MRRRFDFGQLRRYTPELSEPDRLRVFRELPTVLQSQAEADCLERLAYRVDRDEDLGGTIAESAVREIGSQVAMSWLREVGQPREAPSVRLPRRHLATATSRDDVLLSIDPPDYIESLTGEMAPAHGMTHCPLPDHEDATPSFRAYATAEQGWYCWGCNRGGSIMPMRASWIALAVKALEPSPPPARGGVEDARAANTRGGARHVRWNCQVARNRLESRVLPGQGGGSPVQVRTETKEGSCLSGLASGRVCSRPASLLLPRSER